MSKIDSRTPATETIEGHVLGPGVTCPQFRISDGRIVSLQGVRMADYPKDAELRLTGQFLQVSTCMQGQAFLVVERTPLDGNH